MKTIHHSLRTSTVIMAVTGIILLIASGCKKDTNNPNGSGGPPANEVYMQGLTFTPATLTVTVGTTVKWTNKEAIPHNVVSNTGAFTSPTMNNNAVFTNTFNLAGTYQYRCTFHSGMNGTIIVN
jgi:plastocyanin